MEKQTWTAAGPLGPTLLFGSTSFLSAFLLFQVQPLLSKYITPWFGGGPAVWTVAALFFQTLLFAGYLYAFCVERFVSQRVALAVHSVLLLVAVATLPIVPADSWRPVGLAQPARQVMSVLLAAVGLPYFLLATTAPLVQVWYSRALPLRSPYRLYALSNAGSLLALLSYPTVVEPLFGLRAQAWAWSTAFATFSVACIGCGVYAVRTIDPASCARNDEEIDQQARVARGTVILWLLLPFGGAALLLAITNYLCQEVASLPLLWVVPLALYLVTFILCFESDRWYRRPWWLSLALACAVAAGFLWGSSRPVTVGIYLAVSLPLLFAGCMVCHGELARIKPPVSGLTAFYLCLAGGGAVGSGFVTLLAPRLFTNSLELPLAVIGCGALALLALRLDPKSWLSRQSSIWPWVAALLVYAHGAAWLLSQYSYLRAPVLFRGRNFFGIVEVLDTNPHSLEHRARMLRNGRITHGAQYTYGPRHNLPLHYFGPESGVGQVLSRRTAARRVGVVGLGIGTLAAYGANGDVYRFYEINPLVIAAAQEWFTYLRDSAASIDIVEGDARLQLERELAQSGSQGFDVLVLDAFSGDAIPTHLLTREAFAVFDRHLTEQGVLAVHVSNRHFDLTPVVVAALANLGYATHIIETTSGGDDERLASVWVISSKNAKVIDRASDAPASGSAGAQTPPWSDDYTNLWNALR